MPAKNLAFLAILAIFVAIIYFPPEIECRAVSGWTTLTNPTAYNDMGKKLSNARRIKLLFQILSKKINFRRKSSRSNYSNDLVKDYGYYPAITAFRT